MRRRWRRGWTASSTWTRTSPASRRCWETGIRSKCVTLLIDGPADADPWGREALYLGDEKVGRLTSGGWSVAFGKQIGMGYVRPDLAEVGTKLELRMFRELYEAQVVEDSPYDPQNAVIRKDG